MFLLSRQIRQTFVSLVGIGICSFSTATSAVGWPFFGPRLVRVDGANRIKEQLKIRTFASRLLRVRFKDEVRDFKRLFIDVFFGVFRPGR